jgi:hypothetical protein
MTVMSLYPPPIHQTYYVSGPISGDTEGNIKKFASAVRALRARDYTVISPVEVCEALSVPDPEDWAWYMRRDIEAMMQDEVQGIIMLPGWEYSEGARLELLIAKALVIRVHSLAECLVREPVLEIKS